jgi:hypothetical protein
VSTRVALRDQDCQFEKFVEGEPPYLAQDRFGDEEVGALDRLVEDRSGMSSRCQAFGSRMLGRGGGV